MQIIFRVCERQDTLSFIDRWNNKDKIEIIKKVWVSMQPSIDNDDNIIILEDQCSEELLTYLKTHCNTTKVEVVSVPKHEPFDPQHYILLGELLEARCNASPEDVFYIVEDDYLHLPQAIEVCKSLYAEGYEGFCLPYDYPDRYTIDRTRTCDVFLNSRSHWRTVPSSTATAMAQGKTWLTIIEDFKRHSHHNDDSYSYKAFRNNNAVCPIPGLTAHLTPNHVSPFTDWEALWEKIPLE